MTPSTISTTATQLTHLQLLLIILFTPLILLLHMQQICIMLRFPIFQLWISNKIFKELDATMLYCGTFYPMYQAIVKTEIQVLFPNF